MHESRLKRFSHAREKCLQRVADSLRIFLGEKMPGIDRLARDIVRPHLPGVERCGRGAGDAVKADDVVCYETIDTKQVGLSQ